MYIYNSADLHSANYAIFIHLVSANLVLAMHSASIKYFQGRPLGLKSNSATLGF